MQAWFQTLLQGTGAAQAAFWRYASSRVLEVGMPPRSNWKGYLKLSLVSCPIALFSAASDSERIAFHMLNKETGNRLKQQYVDAETADVVERDDRVKGYEIAKDDFVVVSEEELSRIEIESSRTIDIQSFSARAEVDPVYFDNHYYIAPDDEVGAEAFAVIREAMQARDMVGIARIVLYGRERSVMLEPRSKGILATTLRYAYEARDDKAYFDDIPDVEISKEMLDLGLHMIDLKTAKFDPTKFKDEYQEAVVDLIRAKRAGRPAPESRPAAPSNVVNLVDALRRSLGAEGEDGARPPSGTKKAAGEREPASPAKSSASRKAKEPTAKTRVRKAS
jgi:DNA end-binding protein Ku